MKTGSMEKQKGEFAPGDNALKFWGESTRRIHHVFIWESGVFWWREKRIKLRNRVPAVCSLQQEEKVWEQSIWRIHHSFNLGSVPYAFPFYFLPEKIG